MYFFEQIGIILSGMLKNKLRVFLTMLGVIVGVCSVVLIISVGFSAADVVKMYFAGSLGDNRIITYISSKNGKDFNMTYDELNDITERISIFEGPLLESETILDGTVLVDDSHYSSASMKGVSYTYSKAYQIVLEAGRFLSKSDCKYKTSAAVISSVAAENCFGDIRSAVGKPISLRTDGGKVIDLVVVGVYKTIDTSGKLDKLDDKRTWTSDIYCSYEYMNDIMGIDTKNLKFSEFSIITKNDTDMDAAIGLSTSVMKKRFDDKDYKYNCYRGFSMADETNGTITMLTLIFIAAAFLSLIVGGISLMNTMLVTVKERTKEIGTRKAIGASNSSIVFQFLLESVIICLVACAIGVAIGALVILVLKENLNVFFDLVKDDALRSFLKTNDISLQMNVVAILVSMFFSVMVGVVFGVYPSLKAAKMQVTDALRYE